MKRFFLIYLFPICLFSQSSITGILTDKESEEPIAYAHVFFSDSSSGTFTNADGVFLIASKGNISPDSLIISHVGYQIKKLALPVQNGKILLQREKNQLTAVEVKADVDKKWKREYDVFKDELFGSTPFSKECKILNPWVINFSRQKGAFIATADEDIQVANEALGYNIHFQLDYLVSKSQTITIEGSPRKLKELSQREELVYDYNRNRQEAFRGSIYHLAQCLDNNTFKENGFELYLIGDKLVDALHSTATQKSFTKINDVEDILLEINGKKYLDFKGFIQVIYKGTFSKRTEISWIKKEGDPYLSRGLIGNQKQLKLFGTFSNDRLANYLPPDLLRMYFDEQKEIQSLSALIESKLNLKPEEKIYLHTDRDLYFPGEDIWIKGYINYASEPSVHSHKLYVELVGEDTSYVQVLLPIKNGVASGYVPIPDNLSSDHYHITGYTDYSKEQSATHYNKTIQLGIVNIPSNTDENLIGGTLKVFPEGGEITSDILNTIAFELKDNSGFPINDKVTLYEDSVNILSSNTLWEGKGYISFIPRSGAMYELRSENAGIISDIFIAGESSVGMTVKSESNNYSVHIEAKKALKDSIFIATSSNYKITDLYPVFLNKEYTKKISHEYLEEGVNTITVFDSKLEPILERVVYIPPTIPDINFTLEKTDYNKQELVITGEDLVSSASLSVIDLNHTDENNYENILVNTFLRPEIKGRIGQANQIFYSPDNKHHDLLMLVNGWRQIKPIEKEKDVNSTQEGFKISGSVISKRLKRLTGTNIYMINRKAEEPLRACVIKSDGSFSFENVHFTDSSKLFFAFDSKLSKWVSNVEVNVNHEWKYRNGNKTTYGHQNLGNKNRAHNYKKQESIDSTFEHNARLLDEVVVFGKRGSALKKRRYSMASAEILSFEERPIRGYGRNTFKKIDDGIKSIKPIFIYEIGGAVIRDVKLVNTEQPDASRNEIELMIDNSPIQPLELLYMNPADFERIEFVKSYGKNGTLFIYTREIPERSRRKNLFEAKLKGYQTVKDFYDDELILRRNKYLRTIYWNPLINENEKKSTFRLQDPNARMKAILEGFTKKNKPFRIVKTY